MRDRSSTSTRPRYPARGPGLGASPSISDALGAAAAQLGPDLVAIVAYRHQEQGLPFSTVRGVLKQPYEIPVSGGGRSQALARLARRASPTFDRTLEEARQSDAVHPRQDERPDERTAMVAPPSSPGGRDLPVPVAGLQVPVGHAGATGGCGAEGTRHRRRSRTGPRGALRAGERAAGGQCGGDSSMRRLSWAPNPPCGIGRGRWRTSWRVVRSGSRCPSAGTGRELRERGRFRQETPRIHCTTHRSTSAAPPVSSRIPSKRRRWKY